jgi:hypothetical protein
MAAFCTGDRRRYILGGDVNVIVLVRQATSFVSESRMPRSQTKYDVLGFLSSFVAISILTHRDTAFTVLQKDGISFCNNHSF